MKIPNTPFATRLFGSVKETELRLQNIFQWKKKSPPAVLFVLTLVVLFACFGLFACVPREAGTENPHLEPTPVVKQTLTEVRTPVKESESAASAEPTPTVQLTPLQDPLLIDVEYALAVPDFLTAEQQTIYRRANSLYRHAFGAGTAGVEYREFPWSGTTVDFGPEKLEYDGRTYTRANGPFAQWDDFDEAIHSVFTDAFFGKRNEVPIYIEHGGRLYFLDIGRGCGYYYNDNFPDEFRLISRTDTAIEFVLIGHYSQIWPNEGETTQERNERLKRGYEYTYEFPITMVLTENGWRFDQFYSALIDEVGPENALKQNENTLSLYREIMLGSGEFILDGSGTTVKELFGYVGADGNTHYRRPGEFSVLDLDGDGRTEVVIAANDNQYALILREENGTVCGYVRYIRQFNTLTLKQDGTFSWSSGAFDNGTGRIRFEENIYTLGDRIIWETTVIDRITYCQSNGYDEEGNLKKSFFVDRQPATVQEYTAAEARQSAKSDAVWYEFTEEKISAQLGS